MRIGQPFTLVEHVTNLALWRLGLRWLRLKPLTLVWVVGLLAGQLVSVLLIAQVFQGALAVNARTDQITWRAVTMVALGLANSAGLFLSRAASARLANDAARHLRVNANLSANVRTNKQELLTVIRQSIERKRKARAS